MVSDVMFSGAMFVLNVSIACLVPALLVIGLKSVMLFLVMLNFLANSAFVRCVSMMPLLKCCGVVCVLRDLRACCWLVCSVPEVRETKTLVNEMACLREQGISDGE